MEEYIKVGAPALELYDEAIVINMCNNSTLNDLDDTWECKITCTMVTPSAATQNFRETIELMYGSNDSSILESVKRSNGKAVVVTTPTGIRTTKEEGRIALLIGFQNAYALDQDLNFVDLFYDLGVRSMGIAYNYRNSYGDGCTERTDCGLSELGVELVKKLNSKRMLVDLSHSSKQTCLDALDISEAPVIFSHSNARAVVDNWRNVDDEVLKALAKNGGVIGVTAFPSYVHKEDPTLDHVLDHIDHISHLIGTQHIGLGLDLIEGYPNDRYTRKDGTLKMGKMKAKPGLAPQWPWKYPVGLSKRSHIPNLAQGLLDRDYSDDDVLGILGGNFLRVIDEVIG